MRVNWRLTIIGVLSLSVVHPLHAENPTSPPRVEDPLLNKLLGDWNVERKFGNGRTARNVVHGERVLQHQFVELHYRDSATPPSYEAIMLIGYDQIDKRCIGHWADIFGGDYSTDGFASRDDGSNAIEFKFSFHDGELTNRYAFDPQSGTWTSTIREVGKGEWKLFCEHTFTRAGAAK